jgi:hypothetical protein
VFSVKKAKDQPESEPAELASLVGERIRKIRKEEGLSLELFALSHQRATSRKCRVENFRALAPDKNWNFDFLARLCHGGTIKGACV